MACTSPTLRGMAENGVGSARLAGSVGDKDGAGRQLVVAPRGTAGWGQQGGPACDGVPAPAALTAPIFRRPALQRWPASHHPPRAVPHARQPTWDTVGLGPPLAPHLSPRPTLLEDSGEQKGTRPGGAHRRGACRLPASTPYLEASGARSAQTPLPSITAGPEQGHQQHLPAAPAAYPAQQMGHPAPRAPQHRGTAFSGLARPATSPTQLPAWSWSLLPPGPSTWPAVFHMTTTPQCQSSPPQKVHCIIWGGKWETGEVRSKVRSGAGRQQ